MANHQRANHNDFTAEPPFCKLFERYVELNSSIELRVANYRCSGLRIGLNSMAKLEFQA